jgi:RNA 3'-phosphate cyclase
MIEIDGSSGEGGGQVLRTAVAFSALTGKPVRVFNIRGLRNEPGIKAQHLCAVSAVAEISNARVKGSSIGSREMEFYPGNIRSGNISMDVGTAGSVTLVLQALMIPALQAPGDVAISVRGGTDVRWSPPADYLRHVTIPTLALMGFRAEVERLERGYYPAGGGRIDLAVRPAEEIKPLCIEEAGKIVSVKGISHAHSGLGKARVAERCAEEARKILMERFGLADVTIASEYSDALSYGSGITLYAEKENSILGADALGEKGKRAEDVGREAALRLAREIDSKTGLDRHMIDQVIPYLAIAGGSVRTSGGLSMHARTNIDIVNRFGCSVQIVEDKIEAQALSFQHR